MSRHQTHDLPTYAKRVLVLFLVAIAIAMTGIQLIVRQMDAVSNPPIVTLNNVDTKIVANTLSAFIGEEVTDVTLVRRQTTGVTIDLPTLQGFHRFVLENQDDNWVIVDAFRL